MRGPWAGTALRPLTVTALRNRRPEERRRNRAIQHRSLHLRSPDAGLGVWTLAIGVLLLVAGFDHVAAATRPLLDPPDRCPFSAADRLRGERTRRSGLARRQICGFSFGSRRADGRLGDSGRNREVLQPDPGRRRRTSPIHRSARLASRPTGRLVTFWRRVVDSTGIAHQHLGGTRSRRAAAALPRRCGGIRLVRRRGASRLPHPRPGRSRCSSATRPQAEARPIFTASPGRHSHFPIWAPDRVIHLFRPVGGRGGPRAHGHLAHPADRGYPRADHSSRFAASRTLSSWTRRRSPYLASDADGSGPWLYTLDVRRRVPHRVSVGLESYTSLAASADGAPPGSQPDPPSGGALAASDHRQLEPDRRQRAASR